jgi:hypothetical protein
MASCSVTGDPKSIRKMDERTQFLDPKTALKHPRINDLRRLASFDGCANEANFGP